MDDIQRAYLEATSPNSSQVGRDEISLVKVVYQQIGHWIEQPFSGP